MEKVGLSAARRRIKVPVGGSMLLEIKGFPNVKSNPAAADRRAQVPIRTVRRLPAVGSCAAFTLSRSAIDKALFVGDGVILETGDNRCWVLFGHFVRFPFWRIEQEYSGEAEQVKRKYKRDTRGVDHEGSSILGI